MNAQTDAGLQAASLALALTPTAIVAARREAVASRRPVPELLADRFGVRPDVLRVALGAAMDIPVLDMAGLAALTPAFERMNFGEAAARGCFAAIDGAQCLVVIADPFDDALQAWCLARLGVVPQWRLADAADIAAVLSRHEDSMRAIDSAMPAAQAADGDAGALEDLSIRTIGEGTSVVVRLVQSTLYDALKSGASDIHVESHLNGLVIKYRLDGMLVQVGAPEGRALAEQVL